MKVLTRIILLVAVVAASLTAANCGKQRHNLVVLNGALYEVLNDIHSGEQLALCGHPSCAGSTAVEVVPGWTKAQSEDFNKKFLPAIGGGREFNSILETWQPGTPIPPKLTQIIQGLGQSLTKVTADFPKGSTREAILGNIGRAQSIVLNAVSIILAR